MGKFGTTTQSRALRRRAPDKSNASSGGTKGKKGKSPIAEVPTIENCLAALAPEGAVLGHYPDSGSVTRSTCP